MLRVTRLPATWVMIVASVVLMLSSALIATAEDDESVSRITGTEGFPEDVGSSHFGSFFPMENLSQTGMWIRPHIGPFIWGRIESEPGTYDWRDVDWEVRSWQRQRVAILATVFPFASWDQESCHATQPRLGYIEFPELGELRYLPCDMDRYAAWLTALVERYDGDGVDDMPELLYPIHHWEILNEPDSQLTPDLTFFQEGPEAYGELLDVSYQAVKSADPTAVVLAAAPMGIRDEALGYMQDALGSSRNAFTLGNVHYIGGEFTDAFYASEYRAFLDGLGCEEKGFWITEAAVGGTDNRRGLTDDELGQLTVISFAKAFAYGAEVVICIPASCNLSARGRNVREEVVCAFEVMATTIGNFVSAEFLAENAVRFLMPDGRDVYVLWDYSSLWSYVQAGTATVITYDGEEYEQDVTQVTADVPMLVIVE